MNSNIFLALLGVFNVLSLLMRRRAKSKLSQREIDALLTKFPHRSVDQLLSAVYSSPVALVRSLIDHAVKYNDDYTDGDREAAVEVLSKLFVSVDWQPRVSGLTVKRIWSATKQLTELSGAGIILAFVVSLIANILGYLYFENWWMSTVAVTVGYFALASFVVSGVRYLWSQMPLTSRLVKAGLVIGFLLFSWMPMIISYFYQPASAVVNKEPGIIEQGAIEKQLAKIYDRPPVPTRGVPAWTAMDIKVGAKRRSELSAEQKTLRELLLVDQLTFSSLNTTEKVTGFQRMKNYTTLVSASVANLLVRDPQAGKDFAEQTGLQPENLADYFLAILGKESSWSNDCESGTGPVCPAGISIALGEDEGLVKGNQDLRKVPEHAIPMMVEYAYGNYQKLNRRWDLAALGYHTGRSRALGLVKIAQEENLQWKTYMDIYFADPDKYPQTWAKVQEIHSKDFGDTYWPGIIRYMELISVFRTDEEAFQEIAKAQLRRVDGRNIAPKYKFHTFFDESLLNFEGIGMLKDLNDLKAAAAKGLLVTAPNHNSINYRTADDRGIGANDKANGLEYKRLRPLGIGGLWAVGTLVGRLDSQQRLDLTSMIRTDEYQKKANTREDVAVPTHLSGLVFDISMKDMKDDDPEYIRIAFALNELENYGCVSWMPEGKAYRAFHVVINPYQKQCVEMFMNNYHVSGAVG